MPSGLKPLFVGAARCFFGVVDPITVRPRPTSQGSNCVRHQSCCLDQGGSSFVFHSPVRIASVWKQPRPQFAQVGCATFMMFQAAAALWVRSFPVHCPTLGAEDNSCPVLCPVIENSPKLYAVPLERAWVEMTERVSWMLDLLLASPTPLFSFASSSLLAASPFVSAPVRETIATKTGHDCWSEPAGRIFDGQGKLPCANCSLNCGSRERAACRTSFQGGALVAAVEHCARAFLEELAEIVLPTSKS